MAKLGNFLKFEIFKNLIFNKKKRLFISTYKESLFKMGLKSKKSN